MSCSLFIGEAAHLFKGLWKKRVLEECIISISLLDTLSRFFLPVCGGTVSTQYGLIIAISQGKRKARES